jgi:hypothetical protein
MEQNILVCDVCGAPASTTVTIKVDGKSLHKDLCGAHLSDLIQQARPARPGRRRSPGPVPAKRQSTARSGKQATSKKATRRKATTKKRVTASRSRRTRAPRAASSPATESVEPSAESTSV